MLRDRIKMNDTAPDVGEYEGRAVARGHPLILLRTPKECVATKSDTLLEMR